jgi:hypothetical protein
MAQQKALSHLLKSTLSHKNTQPSVNKQNTVDLDSYGLAESRGFINDREQ